MNFIISSILTAFAIMFVIIACRIFQSYVAIALGDNTPKLYGTTSLDPRKHIDIAGFLFFMFFRFGWAKPIKINVNNFNNRFFGRILYSLSNAFMCFIIAFIAAFVLVVGRLNSEIIIELFRNLMFISIVFGIIGLLPLPPYDGAIFISAFISEDVEYEYFKLSKYTTFILLALIVTGLFSTFLSPVVYKITNFLVKLVLMLVM